MPDFTPVFTDRQPPASSPPPVDMTVTPEAVIFDMDGLMLDTEGPAIDAWVRAARELGYDVNPAIAWSTVGLDEASTEALVRNALAPDFPHEEVKELMGRIIRDDIKRKGISQKPGLIPLLDHLRDRGIPLAIATSTPRRSAEWKLEKAGLGASGLPGRFSVIVCGDEVDRGKPAPDIFLRAAEKLGQAPERCVGFEDSPAGLMALHAAGIRSIFIKDLLEPPETVLAAVWRRLNRLDEAIPLFA